MRRQPRFDCVDSLELTASTAWNPLRRQPRVDCVDSIRKPQHYDNYYEINDVDSVDFDDFDVTGAAGEHIKAPTDVRLYYTQYELLHVLTPAACSPHCVEIPKIGGGFTQVGHQLLTVPTAWKYQRLGVDLPKKGWLISPLDGLREGDRKFQIGIVLRSLLHRHNPLGLS